MKRKIRQTPSAFFITRGKKGFLFSAKIYHFLSFCSFLSERLFTYFIKCILNFLFFSVFEEFLEIHGRFPSTSTLEADTKELQNLRVQVLNKLGVPAKSVPEDFYL